MTKISPSLLAADYSRLGEELNAVEKAGADWIHLDIMDGAFVPNLSFGPDLIRSLRAHTQLFFDVHLMIAEPIRYLDAFAKAGADLITVHLEACGNVTETLLAIRALGIKAGLAIKPKTKPEEVLPYADLLDMVLVMSVEPGFGGQKFMPESLDRIRFLKEKLALTGKQILIEVDGGVNADNAPLLREAGTDVLVAGSSVFRKENYAEAIAAMTGK